MAGAGCGAKDANNSASAAADRPTYLKLMIPRRLSDIAVSQTAPTSPQIQFRLLPFSRAALDIQITPLTLPPPETPSA